MERDRKVCPRCGKSAGGYHFCPSCLAPIDSPTGGAGSDPSYAVAQPQRDVLHLDQTVAAASGGDHEPPAGAVQVEVDQRPAEDSDATSSGVEISIRTGARDLAGPPRDVARLEDVLKVEPKDREAAPPEVRREESRAGEVVEPAPPVEEIVLPAAPEHHPTYVDAHVLREAFWFEQASALKSKAEADTAPAEQTPPEPQAAATATGAAQPEPAEADPQPDPVAADAQPDDPQEGTQSVVRLLLGKTSEGQWVAAFCLLTLIALVVVLTGRVPRRFIATN